MKLWLCEKPSQGRDIARHLGANTKAEGCLRGPEHVVTWCFGHLLSMAPPDAYGEQYKRWSLDQLPILPSQWLMEIPPDKRRQVGVIKQLLTEASEVVIATDAGREGEVIARELLERFKWRGPVKRLWVSAFDDASVRKALSELRAGDQTQALYLAGLGRARADWMVGMNLTRAFTVIGRDRGHDGVLSVGRVQTPTLRLVVDRDRAIESFTPSPYWEVIAEVKAQGGVFRARWLPAENLCDAEGRCINQQTARSLAQRLTNAPGTVSQMERKREREAPPLPYKLTRLQQDADRLFGLSSQQTLDAAQSLYETHKATSYPRTDCAYLPESMIGEAPKVLSAIAEADPAIADIVAQANATLRSKAWSDKEMAKNEHHAIIPTAAKVDVSRMSQVERQVYGLVRRCYVAQFYPPHEYEQTKVVIAASDERFGASGRRMLVAGWRALFQREGKPEDESGDEHERQQPLPALSQGEACVIASAECQEKQTRPPARYTEASLLADMENIAKRVADPALKRVLRDNAGLGTSATRASIIKTLIDERGFIAKQKRSLISTEPGRALVDAVPDAVKDPATTALWEQTLDDIANGRRELGEFLARQAQWVTALVQQARTSALAVSVNGNGAQHACPDCAKPLRRRKGSKGYFWGCTGYPECIVTLPDNKGKPGRRRDQAIGQCRCGGEIRESAKAWQCEACRAIVWKQTYGKTLSERQAIDLLQGKTLFAKGFTSRSGSPFDAAIEIEAGRVTIRGFTGDAPAPRAKAGQICPKCRSGSLVQRFSRGDGRTFLGCTHYPKCDFHAPGAQPAPIEDREGR